METSIVNNICELFSETPFLGYLLLVGALACVRAVIKLVFLVIRIIRGLLRRTLRLALAALACGLIPGHDAVPTKAVSMDPTAAVTTAMPKTVNEGGRGTALFHEWAAKIRGGINR